jgi:uncharacterized membrane protein
MVKLKRCRVCGFIIEENKIRKVCPACGAPITAFEDYTPDISEERRKKLNRHMHPVLVHFPEAFAILLVVSLLISILTTGQIASNFFATATVLAIFLPFTVLGAMLVGMYDGKVRFKRITTPALKRKIIISIVYLVLSIILLILILTYSGQTNELVIMLVLAVGCMVCGGLLGLIGGTLLEAKLPNGK